MIENNRDEEFCRQWDALAGEDHTHHLTSQEYFLYKSNWRVHSNKQGSNTVPVRHRPDFKQAVSSLQQFKQREGARRNQQWAQSSSSWWNWKGSWWSSYSSESHDGDEPSTAGTGWPVEQYLEHFFWTTLLNSITLSQMDRLQLTAVNWNRRGV